MQTCTSAKLLSQPVMNKAKTCYPRKAMITTFWMKNSPYSLLSFFLVFYMVFEGSLQLALHRLVTFKRIFFVLKSRNAGCWCLSKKMDEQCVAIKIVAMQLFYKLIIFDSKCSSKFKQQLHESHISAFIFHT